MAKPREIEYRMGRCKVICCETVIEGDDIRLVATFEYPDDHAELPCRTTLQIRKVEAEETTDDEPA